MGNNRKPVGVGVDGRGARKRWSKSKRRPIPYALFMTATCIGIVGLVALTALGISRFFAPYAHQATQERQIAALQTSLDGLNASNAQLQHQLDSLNSQEGIETAARSQRFVEPGEVLLNVTATPAPVQSAEDNSFGGRLKRAWDGLTRR